MLRCVLRCSSRTFVAIACVPLFQHFTFQKHTFCKVYLSILIADLSARAVIDHELATALVRMLRPAHADQNL
jgi:hypothetical protein